MVCAGPNASALLGKALDYFFTPKTASFATLATRNLTTVLAGILILCCVFGLKPVRAFLFCFTSLPKPGKTNSPFFLGGFGKRGLKFCLGHWKRIGMWSIAREALRFNTSKMSISVSSVGNPPLFPSPPYSPRRRPTR